MIITSPTSGLAFKVKTRAFNVLTWLLIQRQIIPNIAESLSPNPLYSIQKNHGFGHYSEKRNSFNALARLLKWKRTFNVLARLFQRGIIPSIAVSSSPGFCVQLFIFSQSDYPPAAYHNTIMHKAASIIKL